MNNITLDTLLVDILNDDDIKLKHSFTINLEDGESGGSKDGTTLTQHGTFDFSKMTVRDTMVRATQPQIIVWRTPHRNGNGLMNNGKVEIMMKTKNAKMTTTEREIHNAKKLTNNELLARIEMYKSLAKERS